MPGGGAERGRGREGVVETGIPKGGRKEGEGVEVMEEWKGEQRKGEVT